MCSFSNNMWNIACMLDLKSFWPLYMPWHVRGFLYCKWWKLLSCLQISIVCLHGRFTHVWWHQVERVGGVLPDKESLGSSLKNGCPRTWGWNVCEVSSACLVYSGLINATFFDLQQLGVAPPHVSTLFTQHCHTWLNLTDFPPLFLTYCKRLKLEMGMAWKRG